MAYSKERQRELHVAAERIGSQQIVPWPRVVGLECQARIPRLRQNGSGSIGPKVL